MMFVLISLDEFFLCRTDCSDASAQKLCDDDDEAASSLYSPVSSLPPRSE